jgi:hypothetical protein
MADSPLRESAAELNGVYIRIERRRHFKEHQVINADLLRDPDVRAEFMKQMEESVIAVVNAGAKKE